MRSIVHRCRRHVGHASPGQALAEFALIAVILLLLFGTVLDLGRAFYANITVENAARAGALQAAKTPDSFTSGACDYTTNKIGCATVNESRGSFVTVAAADIASACEDTAGAVVGCSAEPQPATRSRVTVTTTFTLLTPILAVFFGGQTIDLSATVRADQEALPAAANNTPEPTTTATATAVPTATSTSTPAATASPTQSPLPTASPTPAPTPDCPGLGSTIAPSLVVGNSSGTETVGEARTEWAAAGFTGTLFPTSGQTSKIVDAQWTNSAKTVPLVAGSCYFLTQQVWLDHH